MHLEGDNVVEAIRMESIVVEVIVRGKINQIRIKDVLYMPKLQANLVSVSKLVSNGLTMPFNLNKCFVNICDDETIAIALPEDNLYETNSMKVHEANVANLV